MGASRISNDQATELLLARLGEMKQLAEQIGEGACLEPVEAAIEHAFTDILERYHTKKFEELERLMFQAPYSGDGCHLSA